MWEDVLGLMTEPLREKAKQTFDALPTEFLVAPSSTTGRYHPPDERGAGGLFLHSWRMAMLMPQLIRMYSESCSPSVLANFVVAAICHDAFKPTLSRDEYWRHPLVSCLFVQGMGWVEAGYLCALHEGRWTDQRIFDEMPALLDFKDSQDVRAFHAADYFLSRHESWMVMQPGNADKALARALAERTLRVSPLLLEARIEALEKQNMVYREGLLMENGLVLKQQARIEALEKALRQIAGGTIRRGRNVSYGGGREGTMTRREMMGVAALTIKQKEE